VLAQRVRSETLVGANRALDGDVVEEDLGNALLGPVRCCIWRDQPRLVSHKSSVLSKFYLPIFVAIPDEAGRTPQSAPGKDPPGITYLSAA